MKGVDLGQWRYNLYLLRLKKYGQRYLKDAYKKPSFAKRMAFDEILQEWEKLADKGSLSIVSDGCQNFSVGLTVTMNNHYFVYITKSRTRVYAYNSYTNEIMYEISYKEFVRGGDNQNT